MSGRPLVAVVGGGVSGLTAAHRLAGAEVGVRLLERAGRTGGIVATTREEGRVLEWGPDCFLSTKPWARELAVELGLEGELRSTTTGRRRSFVLRDGRLEPIPEGFFLLAPTAWRPFLGSRVLSWRGKLRAALEPFVPARREEDESLESFVRRRMGGEVFERLVEPLVAGIYTADARELSLRATMPQFLEMEAEHGSVARALWRRRQSQDAGEQQASGARYGLFLTFERGLATLTDALAARLAPGTVELGSEVRALRREARGFALELCRGDEAEELFADAVVLAVPAPVAARLASGLDGELSRLLGTIPYASAATVNVLLRREQVRHPLDGMGFVVPRLEERFVLACSFSSVKFAGRSRPGEVLLRAFVGGALRRAEAELPEAEIERRTLEDLRGLLGIEGAPLRVTVHRWPEAMPQYLLGHLERVEAIEARAGAIPGLALAGNAYRGVGVPDCVRSGGEAASQILAGLGGGRGVGGA